MLSYRQETIVGAPLARVLALLEDLQRRPDWIAAIKQVELLDNGPLGVGSRILESRRMKGRLVASEVQVSERTGTQSAAGSETLALRSTAAGVECTTRYVLEPQGSSTRVLLELSAVPRSFFGKLVARGMLALMVKSDGDQLEGLKQMVEER